MTEELKPCLFCGYLLLSVKILPETCWVKCVKCFACGPDKNTATEAIAAWNTRHDSTAELVELPKEARDIIGKLPGQQRINKLLLKITALLNVWGAL